MKSLLAATVIMMAALQAGPIETIARDSMSRVDTASQQTARNDKEWAALWQAHTGGAKPLPKVDFTSRMVAAVFLGSRSTAGYAVEIADVKTEGKTVTVEWRERRPPADGILAQVITAPAHIVSIPRAEGVITFRKVDR